MHILPVIDLLNGQVVRGIAGQRAEYKPVVSGLTTATDPVGVALAFRTHFGFDELYLADLDAIGGGSPALAVYDALHRHGFRLWVDAGLRDAAGATSLIEAGVATIIAGLETVCAPRVLKEMLTSVSPQQLVFSLDLKQGQPLVANCEWQSNDPIAIATQAIATGVARLLVLDLAQVGVGAGVGTNALCRRLRTEFPQLEIAAGGGVRNADDVTTMANIGVDWLLVASALHDGKLNAAHGHHARNSHVAD